MMNMKRGNIYYSLEADSTKNRIYFSIMGLIPSVDAIPNFKEDWEMTVDELGQDLQLYVI